MKLQHLIGLPLFLGVLSLFPLDCIAQQNPTVSPEVSRRISRGEAVTTTQSSANSQRRVFEVKSEEGMLVPKSLGNFEAQSHYLLIQGPNGGVQKELRPEDFGAQNLMPGKWVTNQAFLFMDTDLHDIRNHYLYIAETDQVYKLSFEVGEQLTYEEYSADTQLKFQFDANGMVIGVVAQ
ncbi:MAG: hypothetical protein AAGI38_00675 [Bacteroidota bacterium]